MWHVDNNCEVMKMMKTDPILEELLQELKETWGYDDSELTDIRKKMVEWGKICECRGDMDASNTFFYGVGYGKISDND